MPEVDAALREELSQRLQTEGLVALCEQLRRPVVSTSANFSGEPAAKTFAEISPELLAAVDYVCEFRRQDRTTAKPSSIIKIDERERITIIRS
jgi:L-threonylcarbamoyladenylate synthase